MHSLRLILINVLKIRKVDLNTTNDYKHNTLAASMRKLI